MGRDISAACTKLETSLGPGFDVHQAVAAPHWLGEVVPSRADK